VFFSDLASLLLERSSSGRKPCPDPWVGADDGGVYGHCFPSWRHRRGLPLLLSMAWVLREKIQASVSRSGRRCRQRRLPLVGVALENQLWRSCVAPLAFGLVDVGAAAPDGGAAAVVCERFALCCLGCGWLSCAVSWLECERWYVGMAVPEGGVGGLRWAWWSSWMSGRRPRKLGSVEEIDLVSRGRQG
jgi:hypothetical protein